MSQATKRLKTLSQRIREPVKAFLKDSYVPEIGKWDSKKTKAFKYGVYISIWASLFFWLLAILHLLYASKLFLAYPMPVMENNYALELSILGGMYGCFALTFWGFQYVINYYRSRWFDPDAKEILDEQHYIKFHGWSHVVLAVIILLGISLISLNLLDYPNKDQIPNNLDQLKLGVILLVVIYGICRIVANRFMEGIKTWREFQNKK